MIRRPTRSTLDPSSAASGVYKRQIQGGQPAQDRGRRYGHTREVLREHVRHRDAVPVEQGPQLTQPGVGGFHQAQAGGPGGEGTTAVAREVKGVRVLPAPRGRALQINAGAGPATGLMSKQLAQLEACLDDALGN